MNKDLETLSEMERLLEDLPEKDRERVLDWLSDKYLPEEEMPQESSGTITYWPPPQTELEPWNIQPIPEDTFGPYTNSPPYTISWWK